MSKVETSSTDDNGWSRSASALLAIICALLLLLKLVRWTQGQGHWDTLLPFLTLLIIFLARVLQLKGFAQRISQVVVWLLVIVMFIMLIIE